MPASKKALYTALRVGLVPLLRERWESAKERDPQTHPEIGGYINDILQLLTEKDRFLKEYAPFLSVEHYDFNKLVVYDAKKEKRADVYRYDKEIRCELDKSSDCPHVHFALATLEIARLKVRQSG